MKKTIFGLLATGLLISGNITIAQDISLGLRGGISIPNLTAGGNNANPLNTGYSSRLGADAGIYAEYKFSNLFSLQPMVEYSTQGGKKDGMQALTTPGQIVEMYPSGSAPAYLYARYNSEAKMNYLVVPVLAKFGWNIPKSPFRIYVDAGPFIAILLDAHQVTSGESPLYLDASGQQALPTGSQSFNNTQDIKNQLHAANFGAEGNLGLSFRFGKSSIFIEGGGNYGFLNIQKSSANGQNNTGAGTADAGYSYRFGK